MSKSYSFISFLESKDNYNNSSTAKLSAEFLNYKKMRLQIETLSYLHIWSGMYSEKDGVIYRTFIKSNDRYIIPGSSLKGCIRTVAEMVSYSCMGVAADKQTKEKMPVKKWHEDKGRRCIVCDMFGAPGYKSKLIFHDFAVVGEGDFSQITELICIPPSFRPHPHECDDYKDENGKFKGYKIYNHGKCKSASPDNGIWIEAIKPGVKFEGEIWFRSDLSQEQIKLLCFSLGLSGFDLKIGYGKNHCLGSIRISAVKGVNKFSQYVKECEPEELIKLAKDFEDEADYKVKENIKRIKEVWRIEK
ncbi:RAMP superfamily CRISPR-associated protein [Anaerocellum danielii]|uniref:RAMP superfamily CRISPR-associated protein n=1 Tax=Anaerocellum danielii TaxID=1387557 RepID=A0ABZ0TZ78_9FIRM|nr:RAMP superfamily CRISPR-associated protein [Caldicellulosiruptor danielii]WPX08781.1 RAMP superfamily CRISPR-associated protein [Caldicellulosiruptor danielii]